MIEIDTQKNVPVQFSFTVCGIQPEMLPESKVDKGYLFANHGTFDGIEEYGDAILFEEFLYPERQVSEDSLC